MQKIYKVSQLPYDDLVVDDDAVYYNHNIREIITKTNNGVQKFQVTVPPRGLDSFSINGFYPLYQSRAMAEHVSPLTEVIEYNEEMLRAPAPAGVSYPVYMPVGTDEFYYGNYLDPRGDENNNTVLNYRDPQEVGFFALPHLDYYREDPYVNPLGNEILNVLEYLSKPDVGTYNDTPDPVAVCSTYPGIIVNDDGSFHSYVYGRGACMIPPSGILFQDVKQNSTVLSSASSPFAVDPYVTPSGRTVMVSNYGKGFKATFENKEVFAFDIYMIFSGIIISTSGAVTAYLPGKITLQPGDVVVMTDTFHSTLSPFDPLIVGGMFRYGDCELDVYNLLSLYIDEGSINESNISIDMLTSTNGILINLNGCGYTLTSPGVVTIPPNHVLFTEFSRMVYAWLRCNVKDYHVSIQWFEQGEEGELILRQEAHESSEPAVQFWETEDLFLFPREYPYATEDESAQYFEEDEDGDVRPTESIDS
jgi:hypothetical protein